MHRYIHKRGFTLLEMLIVMAMIALLLSIALPRYFGSLEKSKEIALKENLKVLRLTLDQFYADQGHYPEILEELVAQKYLRTVPPDPITESAKTWILIPSENNEAPGVIDVKSGAKGAAKDGQPYASF